MKLFLSVMLIFMVSCTGIERSPGRPIEKFDWLPGSWERVNEEKGKATYEQWRIDNDSTYSGLSYTLKARDTIWKENVLLRKIDANWYYDVFQGNNSKPTSFLLTAIDKDGFICVNERNEFPKKISYRRSGDNIHAVISDENTEVKFDFRKMD